ATNVYIGYYDQKQAEFTSERTILEELWHEYPHMKESDVRGVLGRFLFTQDEVLKRINDLSGGEKARIQLARLMLEENNLLILDEPTNHLDIDSKEVLENALKDYPGTIIFVSHDRYFIDRIATKVMEIGHRAIDLYHGDYSYYIHKKEERESLEIQPEPVGQKNSDTGDYASQKQKRNEMQRLKRKVAKIEDAIHGIEHEIGEIEETLLDPEVYGDYEKADAYNQQHGQKNQELEALMAEWEQTEELVDE